MRNCLILLLLATSQFGFSQTVEETYPKTLWCPNDSFTIKYKGYDHISLYTVSRTDKISPGTDASPGGYATIFYGTDSLRLNYHNKIPYAHIIFINFTSPKGKTTLRFHFNDLTNYLAKDYQQKNLDNVQFDIPETYELANIIWTLSASGQRAGDLYKQSDYYQRVLAHFKPWMNHPLLKQLDFSDSVYYQKYYDFRENSFAFNFEQPKPGSKSTRLLFNGPYYYVYGDELADSSLFGKLKPLVEDFAAKTKFREFYNKNLAYYKKAIDRERSLLPVRQMWVWLEQQFPERKYQSYRVVFSPLIGGSHSTQRYGSPAENGWFTENIMFICGADRYDSIPSLSEKQKEGLMSGIVFTEIDHNYVNPTTSKFRKTVDSIFSNRQIWVKKAISNDGYDNATSVFNEYMTHAAFCLCVADSYDKTTADFVIQKREELMVDRRGFIRFKEFNQELLRLHKEQPDKKLVELYGPILQWSGEQH